jgi:hypothetical protein
VCALLGAGPAAAAGLEGLWEGLMVFKRGELEVEFVLELARAADAADAGDRRLVGTIDLPNQHLLYHPVDRATLDGDQGAFAFTWLTPDSKVHATVAFSGTLSPDGQRFDGLVEESDAPGVRSPFSMTRVGDAGTPRRTPPAPALRPLSPAGAELREAFNADAGKTRLLLLLSPT